MPYVLDRKMLRGALMAAALCGVVFPALATGIHVHEGHVGDDCDLCLQLAHLVFAMADDGPAADRTALVGYHPEPQEGRTFCAPLSSDPARAPPVPS